MKNDYGSYDAVQNVIQQKIKSYMKWKIDGTIKQASGTGHSLKNLCLPLNKTPWG